MNSKRGFSWLNVGVYLALILLVVGFWYIAFQQMTALMGAEVTGAILGGCVGTVVVAWIIMQARAKKKPFLALFALCFLVLVAIAAAADAGLLPAGW